MQTETVNQSKESGTGKKDVYAIITEKIIEQLNKGTVPWRKPWIDAGIPRNLVSRRSYRGINIMLLACLGYERNLFLTSKQLKDIGGSIKPDEKPHLVVYLNYGDKKADVEDESDETKDKKRNPVLRYYTVFNVSQCEWPLDQVMPVVERTPQTHALAEHIVSNMPNRPQVKFKEAKAYYDPRLDFVNMPKHKTFESDAAYYSTLFHELIHSTGHVSRLNRKDLIEMSEFGADAYSREELTAEIGACYLQSVAGIVGQFEQNAAYIQGWLKRLQNDRKFIFSAAIAAQKATDYILLVKPEQEPHED